MSRPLQTALAVVVTFSLLIVAGASLVVAKEIRRQTTQSETQTCYLRALSQANFQMAAYGSLAARGRGVNAITDATKKSKDAAALRHDFQVMLKAANACN